jgi:hypothetical protein
LKTVYNYLSRYPGKIRTKKEFSKKYVHVEDFTNIFQRQVQTYNTASQQIDKPKEQTDD